MRGKGRLLLVCLCILGMFLFRFAIKCACCIDIFLVDIVFFLCIVYNIWLCVLHIKNIYCTFVGIHKSTPCNLKPFNYYNRYEQTY